MRWTVPLVAATVLLAGCGERGPADPGQLGPGDLSAVERQAFVYAAAIRHLVEAEGQDPGRIYVLDRAVKGAADPTGPAGEGDPIPQGVHDRVREELALLGRVVFVSDRDEVVEASSADEVRNQGILITLGPVPSGGDRVEVEASGYRNLLSGSWQTLVLERHGLRWQVTGTTGPVAMS
jgi:hypothetical protein